jgi:hypothetical protein
MGTVLRRLLLTVATLVDLMLMLGKQPVPMFASPSQLFGATCDQEGVRPWGNP